MALLPEILLRRSRKKFANRNVPKEIVTEIITAAQLAPSCFNNQPARFIIVHDEHLKELHPALSRGNAWAKEAPFLLALTSRADLDCQITDRDYFLLGCGLQLENLILQAVHRGLFAHPLAGFNEDVARSALGVPVDHRIYTLVAVGYPDENEDLEDKGRKPMGEIAYDQSWGDPFNG